MPVGRLFGEHGVLKPVEPLVGPLRLTPARCDLAKLRPLLSLGEAPMTWIDMLGYAASATVLATFCMQTMMPLRLTAILSNILFASFGLWAHIYPVMILHLILFPVNALRLLQIRRLVRGTLQRTDLSMRSILPIMSHRTFLAGEAVIRKGGAG